MVRAAVFLLLAIAVVAIACTKNNDISESSFYGTWVKGSNFGDTLIFAKENGINVLKYNDSFNPALAMYDTVAYRYRNNKLRVAFYGTTDREISSFAWKEEGKVFELLGYQLFPFMSSSVTKFEYRKIR